jgi:hypothetical protein
LSNEPGAIREARVPRAAECRPGRKPVVTFRTDDQSPGRSERCSLSPSRNLTIICRPLRGLENLFVAQSLGLAPGATVCRRLRRLVQPSIQRKTVIVALFVFVVSVFSFIFSFSAHTQSSPAHGVVRLKVRYKSSTGTKDLPRKRFFLIKGSLDQNRDLIDRIKQTSLSSRECYYRSHSASSALIKWLADNDCESVYCRLINEKYLSGADVVPEFEAAYEQARRELKNDNLARRWLTNYLSPEIRSGFYADKQKAIQALMGFAETSTRTSVTSVMTDRKGTAYFTNIEPGVYTISNLVASETEKTGILWVCEREIKAVDLGTAMKRPFTLSNEKDPKIKCEVIERPLPVCATQ